VPDHRETLRKLAIRDESLVHSIMAADRDGVSASGLDPKTEALVRIAALVAVDASPPSYMSVIESGFSAGATVDEIVGTLVSVMPAIGVADVVSAAPKLGLALGYDVSRALEELSGESSAR
jgi:4-carboxymuconolactone decarboxylase